MVNNLPKVSFIIPTLNDERRLKLCLESIAVQDYPKNKIEIIVVDDKSTDNTVAVAKKFNARIFTNGRKDLYLSLAMGLHRATGDLVYQIDQDVELRDKTFLNKMVKPLLEDESITASFTRYYPTKNQSWVSRFLSYDPILRDPIYQYFSPFLDKLIIKETKDYILCDYSSRNIPSFTMMMYRLKLLKKNPLWNAERFFDHETVMAMIDTGYTKYAYVPSAGLYHDHADNLLHLLKKRVRNLKNHYLTEDSPYKYKWFDISTIRGVIKVIAWIIYANLIFPETIRGFLRFIKHRDQVLLMQPIISVSITDTLLISFLTLPRGRSFILKNLLFFRNFSEKKK